MNKSTSNPQPYAVEHINKEHKKEKPTNLDGSEMGKSPQEKEHLVKRRNKNAGANNLNV